MAYTTINDPSAQFQTVLWTGDSADDRSITNTGNANLQPDVVWIKNRNSTQNHYLYDSTRGANVQLLPADSAGETTVADRMQAFQTDGFQVGSSSEVNYNSYTYIGWQWKATAGTTASNGNGSITSTVQANTTAGFSIVKWTGTGSAATIGHGLGVTPQMIIVKNLDKSSQWAVYHYKVGNTKYLALNDADAEATYSGYWNDTSPTTTVFSVGSDGDVSGGNGEEVISYCFAPIKGYSKIGNYKGNGNADGPFVYTGFKPAFIIKKGTGSGDWHISDNKQNSFNAFDNALRPNVTNGTETGNTLDFLSNGFKIRNTGGSWNGNGSTYIYMAFAQNPFVATNNVAATAR